MHAHSLTYRLLAVVLCFLMLPLPVLGQGGSSSQPAGQISAMIPQTTRNGSITKVKDDVMWNDVLRTEGGGRARVQLRDGSILSLGSNSELKVVQHDPATQQTELELNYGRVRSRVTQITKPGGKFEIKTPTAVAGVVGTDFVVVYEGGHMQVIVFSGVVKVLGLDGAVLATVNPGQYVDIVNGQVTGPKPTPPGVQQDNINQTNLPNGAGGAAAASGGGLLRTVLIILGVAAASAIITATTSGSPGPASASPTPTPTPTCGTLCGGARPLRH